MLSRLTGDIATTLLNFNRDCYHLTLAESHRLAESHLANKLRRIASRYRQNAEELQIMLRSHGIEPASEFAPRDSFRSQVTANSSKEVLERVAQAATRLRKEYERGIRATRELSEQLPRQFARVKLACMELNSTREEAR